MNKEDLVPLRGEAGLSQCDHPVAAMAKVHWANSENISWEALEPEEREHMIGMMCAALLELAAADPKAATIMVGVEAYEDLLRFGDEASLFGAIEASFKAMLRYLVETSAQPDGDRTEPAPRKTEVEPDVH